MKKISAFVLAAATLAPSFAFAHEAGDFIFRAGSATVRPNTGSDNVLGLGSLSADNNTQMGLTFGYMITDNIGVELLAGTPFQNRVSLPGVGNIAKIKSLPPTLMAQYYFGSKENRFHPYVGIGLNYTTFFNEKFNGSDAVKDSNLHSLDLKDSWGVAGQVGLDYALDRNWIINASVWWINIETDVKFKAGDQHHKIDTRIDPWVFMFSAGYHF
ncbi:outer membrane protein OmpW [Photorhabdus sp. P32]|uniref:outer membrane protein OmpW n=1 Tax=Photorhabdus TaxID=29487 RepID=UPI00223D1BB7|nr:outer membrane protein OmpW [Photorhabdus aballayi]MCW7546566.1 outer membrane protein OmpW [Photorhabdus aballayi]